MNSKPLADLSAHGEAAEMSAIDAQGVEEMQDIVCEKLDGIRAGVTEDWPWPRVS